MIDRFLAPVELKLAADTAAGEFEGYGSVFGNVDSHGDVVAPGAFSDTLAQHKAAGTMPALYLQHGPALGGDPLPAGVWLDMSEDDRGLKVRGKISALDTDYGKRVRALVNDGALRGLSIGFRVPANGAEIGRKSNGARRTLKSVTLVEVSLVTAPSNSLARADQIKSLLADGRLPQLREMEGALREQFGFSRAQAEDVAPLVLKCLVTRESEEVKATPKPEIKAAARDLAALLAGFSLNSPK